MRAFLFSLFVLGMTPAHATVIRFAQFNSATQTLTLGLIYQGGEQSHNFTLDWDNCQKGRGYNEIAARLIDSGWQDQGTRQLSQVVHFDLSGLSCKPAELTVLWGNHSRQTLWIQ